MADIITYRVELGRIICGHRHTSLAEAIQCFKTSNWPLAKIVKYVNGIADEVIDTDKYVKVTKKPDN
jgi:hypothetical protein